MILCTLNPAIAEAGLMAAPKARPLLYAANATNWKDMAELALMYNCPIVASAPNDLTHTGLTCKNPDGLRRNRHSS